MRVRIFYFALAAFVICTWFTLIAAYAQDEEVEVELLPPDFVSADYNFGLALPDGYYWYDIAEEGTWMIQIEGNPDEGMARISAEELPDGVQDAPGYWQYMKDRDSLMDRNITYEKIDSIANTGAIQARIERIEGGAYILAITWIFVHDGYGFTLTGYPPQLGDYNLAREIAEDLVNQFRWMTDEEIEEFNAVEPEIDIPEGMEF